MNDARISMLYDYHDEKAEDLTGMSFQEGIKFALDVIEAKTDDDAQKLVDVD